MDKKEIVKETFLKNIGTVIKNGRKRKHLTQGEIAEELGVDTSAISRYENAQIDINASTMAYISCICGFPISDYVKTSTNKSLSAMFEDIVLCGESKEGKRIKTDTAYDEMDYGTMPIIAFPQKNVPHEKGPEEEIRECSNYFVNYITKEENRDKQELLKIVDHLISSDDSFAKEIKALAKATERFIVSSTDKDDRRVLSYYVNKVKELYGL